MYYDIPIFILVLFSSIALSYAIAPIILYFLDKFDMRKKGSKRIQKTLYGEEPEVFKQIHPEDVSDKPHALRMGGLLVLIPLLIFSFPFLSFQNNFVLLTLFVIVTALIFGMVDDYKTCSESAKSITIKQKIYFFAILGAIVGYVMHFFLNFDSISFIIFDLKLGIIFILFSAIIFVGWGTSVVIDGIDRLSGTLLTYCYIFTTILFFVEGNFILTLISIVIVGSLQGFLWHNTPPAKVHMGEAGMITLLLLLAFMSLVSGGGGGNGFILITLISLPIHISIISNVIQLVYRKYKGKKLFKIAPIHHNFETKMPSHTVVSRYSAVTFLLFVLCLTLLFA